MAHVVCLGAPSLRRKKRCLKRNRALRFSRCVVIACMECVLFFEAMSTATCVVRQWVSPLNGVLPDGKTAIVRRSAWE